MLLIIRLGRKGANCLIIAVPERKPLPLDGVGGYDGTCD